MLACARIGAVHSVVFAGFSAESLASRVEDCKSRVVVTTSGVMRGKKKLDTKGIVDNGLDIAEKNGFKVCGLCCHGNLCTQVSELFRCTCTCVLSRKSLPQAEQLMDRGQHCCDVVSARTVLTTSMNLVSPAIDYALCTPFSGGCSAGAQECKCSH